MKVETFGNVWDALTDTPAEAANMTARSDLMIALAARVKAWDLPQEEAASRLGITRPRLSDLLRGKIDKFSLMRWSTSSPRPGSTSRCGSRKPHEPA